MFYLGDIVKPKPEMVGSHYEFTIKTIWHDPKGDYYNLKRTSEFIDLRYGPSISQNAEIEYVENANWREDELILVKSFYESTPDKSQKITYSKNLFDGGIVDTIKLNNTGITINSSGSTIYDYYKNIKEDNMKILDLYKERKNREINKNYENEKEEIINKDIIYQIIDEMENQVNSILEEEGQSNELTICRFDFLTKETKENIDKLTKKRDSEKKNLDLEIDEVKALFEMTEDYTERMKILKRYGIIDKSGKVNV